MKIGLLPLYIKLYDDVKPDVGVSIRKFAQTIAGELEKRGLEVVAAPACRVKDEFQSAVSQFEAAGCQAIATLHLAYSPSLESADVIAATSLPVVVIDTTPDYDFDPATLVMPNHGIHGVQDFCNLLLRKHKPFLISCGHWQHSDVLDHAARQLQAAGMAWQMTHSRCGKIGGDFNGMGDFTFPAGEYGIQTVDFVDKPEFMPTEAEIQAEREADQQRFVWDETADDASYRRTIIASLKVRKWLAKEQLQAFTVCFLGVKSSEGWDTVPFLECSKAIARGVGYAGEGDVMTACLAAAVRRVYPQTSFMEMFCPDWIRNRIFTSHMGEINLDLCGQKPLLHQPPYKYSPTNPPVIATGTFKGGKAILIDLAPGPDGYTLIAAPVFWQQDPAPSAKGNRGWFTPACGDIAQFLAAYSRLGGTHHLLTAYDADLDTIADWAHLMDWKFAVLQ